MTSSRFFALPSIAGSLVVDGVGGVPSTLARHSASLAGALVAIGRQPASILLVWSISLLTATDAAGL
jgi:hypothetical protein